MLIDEGAKVTKVCDQANVTVISDLRKNHFYLPPVSVYATDDVALGRCQP